MKTRTPLGALMYGGAVLVGYLVIVAQFQSPRHAGSPEAETDAKGSTAIAAARLVGSLLAPPASPPAVAPAPLEASDLEAQWAATVQVITQLIEPANESGWSVRIRERQLPPTLREFRRLLALAKAGGPAYEGVAWQAACDLTEAFQDVRFQREARKQLGTAAGSCQTLGPVPQANGGTQ